MTKIVRALLCASAFAAATVAASSAIPVAKAQTSSAELFRQKHERDQRRASESFNRTRQEAEAGKKAHAEAARRQWERWRAQGGGPH
jgi:hypothetical protein